MNRRPSRGISVHFDAADGTLPTQSSDPVLGLRFDIEARFGGVVRVDLTDLHPRALAIAFAGALRRQAELGGSLGAATSIKQHVRAYRRFFAYLEGHSSATRASDLRAEDIDGYETFLEAGGMKPIHRHTVIAKAILALRSIESDQPGILEKSLSQRLTYTSARPAGRSRPRDAYSPFIARQLRDAARKDIGRTFRRIGRPLDEPGDDTLRSAINAVETKISSEGRIPHADSALQRLYAMRRRRGLPVSDLCSDVHGRYHLRAMDIPPILTLLSLETGIEIECCKTLTIDCLQNPGSGTVEVVYVKRRSRGSECKFLRVRDGGIGTPGGLIRKLIEVTAFTRRFVQTDCLWVYYYTGRGQLRSGVGNGRQWIDRWVKERGIVDDQGQPFRLTLSQLRKTHKALWYLKTEGHMARFAVGHTPEVAARHYADIPSLRPLHEETVAEAFSEVVLATGPTILSPEDEIRWRHGGDTGTVVSDNRPNLLDGVQDIWLASCSGFNNSPFGEEGSPCPQPFWGCLECRNAVITVRKLPAILAFLDVIEEERGVLSATHWNIKFGRAHGRITQQILPAFSEQVIAEARNEIGAGTLYLPPEARS